MANRTQRITLSKSAMGGFDAHQRRQPRVVDGKWRVAGDCPALLKTTPLGVCFLSPNTLPLRRPRHALQSAAALGSPRPRTTRLCTTSRWTSVDMRIQMQIRRSRSVYCDLSSARLRVAGPAHILAMLATSSSLISEPSWSRSCVGK